jgi:hypothetical protein
MTVVRDSTASGKTNSSRWKGTVKALDVQAQNKNMQPGYIVKAEPV